MNQLERLLEDRICNEVPGSDGFWVISAETAYLEAGKRLFAMGWEANTIIDFLSNLFNAAKREFDGGS